jgi:hypothetical protein
MAIKKTITKSGVVINDCYIKVASVGGDKSKMVFVAAMKANADAEHFSTEQFSFVPKLDGVNFIAQAYSHLKTLPEFSGSQDC